MKKAILIRYGEIHLKGKNRPFFERALKNQIRRACGDIECEVSMLGGRYYIREYDIKDENVLLESVLKVFGVHSISIAYVVEKDKDALAQKAVDVAREQGITAGTFKVDVKRADKRFKMNSMNLAAYIGEKMLEAYPGLKVKMGNPEHMVYAEVREECYIYINKIMGPGGMPVGTGGKAMLLLSGGIDSPVAGYLMAKRGLQLRAVHYHSFPFTSERAKQKVIDLRNIMQEYCGNIPLSVVPFTRIQEEIHKNCEDRFMTIIMRYFMMRIAEAAALKYGCKALITGESLGQVASQTIDSLAVSNSSVDLPVFRPLIAMDKIEIMDLARRIDTYETSILPYEDCCTVFLPKHPVTKPKLSDIMEEVNKLDTEELINEAVEGIEQV
jgi:thiamine biosynthesis protein ThiI